jgi:MFS-type transporter involved in bile tolerance (Atg22 family)
MDKYMRTENTTSVGETGLTTLTLIIFMIFMNVVSFQILSKLLGPTLIEYLTFKEPCVLYIGRPYRYPPNVAFYIFFQQI